MKSLILLVCSILTWFSHVSSQEIRVLEAIAYLYEGDIVGTVTFTQESDDVVRVVGNITGMEPGNYGFHVHELGDVSDGCTSTGSHYNPYGMNHGAPDANERHVGDLGNVIFDDTGVAYIDINDTRISLNGFNSIVGRGLVLHEGEDDLGLGEHELSLTTGNAGARLACAVIGISRTEVSNSAADFKSTLAASQIISVISLFTKLIKS